MTLPERPCRTKTRRRSLKRTGLSKAKARSLLDWSRQYIYREELRKARIQDERRLVKARWTVLLAVLVAVFCLLAVGGVSLVARQLDEQRKAAQAAEDDAQAARTAAVEASATAERNRQIATAASACRRT